MNTKNLKEGLIRRRALLIAPFAFAGLVALSSKKSPEDPADSDPDLQFTIIDFDSGGKRLGPVTVRKIVKSDAEWKRRLSAEQFYVTRRQSTDSPFTGTYYDLHRTGLFRCICCGTVVFTSAEKFDSGTGWPSFWASAADENIRTVKDVSMFMERVEVRCKRCDAHLGHRFNDGPPPTNLRYCINESALRFVATA